MRHPPHLHVCVFFVHACKQQQQHKINNLDRSELRSQVRTHARTQSSVCVCVCVCVCSLHGERSSVLKDTDLSRHAWKEDRPAKKKKKKKNDYAITPKPKPAHTHIMYELNPNGPARCGLQLGQEAGDFISFFFFFEVGGDFCGWNISVVSSDRRAGTESLVKPAFGRRRAYQETRCWWRRRQGRSPIRTVAYHSLPYLQCGQFKGVRVSSIVQQQCSWSLVSLK